MPFYSATDRRELNIQAVIDSRILAELQDEARVDSISSQASSLQDWLVGSLILCVADEQLVKRATSDHNVAGEKGMSTYLGYPCLDCDVKKFDEIHPSIREFFPELLGDHAAFNLRQVARAIGAGASIYLTHQTGLLRFAEEFEKQFSIFVLNPTDLISHFHKYQHACRYQPARLAAKSILVRKRSKLNLKSVSVELTGRSENGRTFSRKASP